MAKRLLYVLRTALTGTHVLETGELIADLFLPAFQNDCLAKLDDQAVLQVDGARLAFTSGGYCP